MLPERLAPLGESSPPQMSLTRMSRRPCSCGDPCDQRAHLVRLRVIHAHGDAPPPGGRHQLRGLLDGLRAARWRARRARCGRCSRRSPRPRRARGQCLGRRRASRRRPAPFFLEGQPPSHLHDLVNADSPTLLKSRLRACGPATRGVTEDVHESRSAETARSQDGEAIP